MQQASPLLIAKKKRIAKKPIRNTLDRCKLRQQIRKRGRPKLTWVEGIRGLMGEKGLVEEDWND
jgi:hypothetical protein